jgi:hypothetical protein
MNHELKDLVEDAQDKAREICRVSLALALGYGAPGSMSAFLGTFDDLLSIVRTRQAQLVAVRRAVL